MTNSQVEGLSCLSQPGLGYVESSEHVTAVNTTMIETFNRLCQKIKEIDPHIRLVSKLGGSTAEGTKTGLPDEFDFLLCFKDLEGCVYVYHMLNYGATLKVKKAMKGHPLAFAFNEEHVIKPEVLYMRMYKALCRALADPQLLEGLPLCFKYIEREQIHFEYRGKGYPMMAIKADIVLATEMHDFWPEGARNQCKLLPKLLIPGGHRLAYKRARL